MTKYQIKWLLKAFDKLFFPENRSWKFIVRLLGKLLMDYTSSIAPSTSNIIARAYNILNCSTRAGSN